MEGKGKRDPKTEVLIEGFVGLVGPDGLDLSTREVQAEMKALDVELSYERIRQYFNGQWQSVNPSSRRKIRAYMKWKTANPSAEAARVLIDEAAREESERKEQGRTKVQRGPRGRKG